jgi:Flp pilus assembly pilin Flp
MIKILRNFLSDKRAATAIEYALIVGLIGLVVVGSLDVLYRRVGNQFSNAATALK